MTETSTSFPPIFSTKYFWGRILTNTLTGVFGKAADAHPNSKRDKQIATSKDRRRFII
jgi:hypothetical protein